MNKKIESIAIAASIPFLFACAVPASSSFHEGLSKEGVSSENAYTSSLDSMEVGGAPDFAPDGYRLFWSDEFNGNQLNQANWSYEIGNGKGGWGNNEAQYYTDSNDEVSGGTLKIFAKREAVDDYRYTSTRIRTYGKVSTTYGYICARIKMSAVTGLWPAFWMLPETGYGEDGVTWWPTSGEIDIMENKGRISDKTSGALHYSSDGTGGNHTYLSGSANLDSIEKFHVYAVEWTEYAMYWSVDGEVFMTIQSSVWNRGYATEDGAPFHKEFHILLNMAVGGQFDNMKEPPNDWTESTMEVDYVRVYHASEDK